MAPVAANSTITPTTGDGLSTRLQRLGYRIANKLIQADRQMRSAHGRGVKLIVGDSVGRLLLVRHTYGRHHWTFPGGGVRATESPSHAARRECLEELGFRPSVFELLGTYPARSSRRIDVVTVVSISAADQRVTPSPIELGAIGWFLPSELPADLDPYVSVALGLLQGHRAEIAASRDHAT